MASHDMVATTIDAITAALTESGYFKDARSDEPTETGHDIRQTARMRELFSASRDCSGKLQYLAALLIEQVIGTAGSVQRENQDPVTLDPLCEFLGQLVKATANFRKYNELAGCYGDILSLYIMTLSKSAGPGRNSLIIEKILRNIARRKASELSHARIYGTYSELQEKICVAMIAKRYAVHLLVTEGFTVRIRAEIDFGTFGSSPEELALQIINILIKNGIKIADVGDLVCGGGDLGPIPDGIYVLDEAVREESRKRLQNSSLNRGPLVAWELMRLLRAQRFAGHVNASVCSPLSFSTLAAKDVNSFLREKSREVDLELKGYVKITPLKSMAALISEIEETNPENLNILVMTLDELFASAVKKIGPRIEREMAAQDANRMLLDFDFGKVMDQLNIEHFIVPPSFRLGARDMGTGVREICELLMIVESASISRSLKRSLTHIIDSYARQVAMVMEMAAAGKPEERPHYILLTSTLAREPYFLKLFKKIREHMSHRHAPIMCLDSLEYEYLIANHFFELYVNPEKSDKRLNISLEARSIRKALRVLSSSREALESFSYAALLQQLKTEISAKRLSPANVVVVGGENEDVLVAVSQARDQGLIMKLSLIGDPNEISSAIKRAKLQLAPGFDPLVRIIPTDPLAVDPNSKKKSKETTFREFINSNPEFIVVKGSVDTATLLHVALSVYKKTSGDDAGEQKTRGRLASSTAIFVLPDGRFFALSDAAVNPSFRSADALLQAIENQMDVLRKLVQPGMLLKVAIITAVEKETSAIPTTLLAAETTKKVATLEAQYGPLILEGPLSFDLATVPDVVSEKNYEGKIRGDANCLIATEINTANVVYKMLSKTMGSLGLMVDNGAIITAGPGTVPIVLTSRGDTAQTKFNSILLALAYVSKDRQNE